MSEPAEIKRPDPSAREVAIYELDSEFYRHQDSLMWGRFQTAATVEGAMLFALFGLENPICEPTRTVLMVSGMVLVAIICILGLLDAGDARFHFDRLRKFEGTLEADAGRSRPGRGFWLMVAAIVTVNAANILILCHDRS